MNEEQTYFFHQTPSELGKDLMQFVPLQTGDVLCEPFRGEGAFFHHFPEGCGKVWAEIKQGRDYTDLSGEYDWVITNPPFRLETGAGRVNSFWYLLDYFTLRAKKGVCFLGKDSCFGTLTPKRLQILKSRGFSITRIVVCSVKKWAGRYYFLVLEKKTDNFLTYLANNY